jgi:hypothetical protein
MSSRNEADAPTTPATSRPTAAEVDKLMREYADAYMYFQRILGMGRFPCTRIGPKSKMWLHFRRAAEQMYPLDPQIVVEAAFAESLDPRPSDLYGPSAKSRVHQFLATQAEATPRSIEWDANYVKDYLHDGYSLRSILYDMENGLGIVTRYVFAASSGLVVLADELRPHVILELRMKPRLLQYYKDILPRDVQEAVG